MSLVPLCFSEGDGDDEIEVEMRSPPGIKQNGFVQDVSDTGSGSTPSIAFDYRNRKGKIEIDGTIEKLISTEFRLLIQSRRKDEPLLCLTGAHNLNPGDIGRKIPNCDQGRLDSEEGICKLGGEGGLRLYRCTRLDGNPLAPQSAALDTMQPGSAVPGEQGFVGQADSKEASGPGGGRAEAAKSALHRASCLSRQQSAVACGDERVLCEISSAPVSRCCESFLTMGPRRRRPPDSCAWPLHRLSHRTQALAEFSSPEACTYQHRVGFVPHDTKQDLMIAEMAWKDAKVR